MLGKDTLAVHVDHGQPFQPVFPSTRLVAEVFHAADKIASDRAGRNPSCTDGYRGRTSPPPGHTPHDFIHHPRHILFLQPQQKAI